MQNKAVAQEKLLHAMQEFLNHYGTDRTYWIAFSGGLDSHVLLSLCHSLNLKCHYRWHAIYINHGLSPHADAWASHCALICKNYGINFISRSIQVDPKRGESIEDSARKKRYVQFAEYLKPNDMLLTAHHQDDQAETVLMQLVRGSGLKGLSAMPMVKSFGLGFHGRPLLNLPRSVLEQYAKEEKLNWIEDESNQNLQLTRNFFRHEILPLLKKRFPSVTKTVSRTATHCAEAEEFINDSLNTLALNTAKNDETLSVSKLLSLSVDQQKFMLRQWIERNNHPMPTLKKLMAILENVLHARSDKNPCVRWEEVELRRYRDQLFIQTIVPNHEITETFSWDFLTPLILKKLGILHAERIRGVGLREDIKQVLVRFRREGEMVLLPHRGRHALKKIFQEKGIPPWERSRIPLVFIEKESSHLLIGMVGYFFDESHCAKDDESGWQIYFKS